MTFRSMRERTAIAGSLFALLFALTACAGAEGGTGVGGGSVLGRYDLRTIDGTALPAPLISAPNVRLEILSAHFVLEAGGRATGENESLATVTGSGARRSRATAEGTYTVRGTEISFDMVTFTEGASARSQSSGTIDGGRITLVGDGKTFVYQR